jgi:hypothetical protein
MTAQATGVRRSHPRTNVCYANPQRPGHNQGQNLEAELKDHGDKKAAGEMLGSCLHVPAPDRRKAEDYSADTREQREEASGSNEGRILGRSAL